jgi:tripartite-type tricarboxylate transporter receptor subunit TctC
MTATLRAIVAGAFATAAAALPLGVAAQSYPSKPIRFIAAFPPGGPSDIVSRAIAKRMSDLLGQPVVVENRAGAGGNIGAEFVAKAPPDGYTVLLGGSYITIAPSLYRKLPFDPLKDFAPIGLMVSNQYVLLVHPSVPAKSVNDLIRVAKARAGTLNFGSAGIGSPPHLAGELLKVASGINATHVPYKGATPALADLMGGHIDFYFGGISGALPHIKTEKVRALGVTSLKRSSQLPQVPTIAEAALPGYEITTWFGLLAAAGTPKEIVTRLNGVITGIVNEPDSKAYLVSQGVDPVTNTPEQFSAFLKAEIEKFAKLTKVAGLVPE